MGGPAGWAAQTVEDKAFSVSAFLCFSIYSHVCCIQLKITRSDFEKTLTRVFFMDGFVGSVANARSQLFSSSMLGLRHTAFCSLEFVF